MSTCRIGVAVCPTDARTASATAPLRPSRIVSSRSICSLRLLRTLPFIVAVVIGLFSTKVFLVICTSSQPTLGRLQFGMLVCTVAAHLSVSSPANADPRRCLGLANGQESESMLSSQNTRQVSGHARHGDRGHAGVDDGGQA